VNWRVHVIDVRVCVLRRLYYTPRRYSVAALKPTYSFFKGNSSMFRLLLALALLCATALAFVPSAFLSTSVAPAGEPRGCVLRATHSVWAQCTGGRAAAPAKQAGGGCNRPAAPAAREAGAGRWPARQSRPKTCQSLLRLPGEAVRDWLLVRRQSWGVCQLVVGCSCTSQRCSQRRHVNLACCCACCRVIR
jgi:hypothetical protein